MSRWDRKQVGFFLLLGWVVLISVIAISAVARSEDRSGDERAALSLLNSLLPWEETRDGPEAVSARDRAHLKHSAALIPNELRTAHLIFLRGLDPHDIETLIGSLDLEPFEVGIVCDTAKGPVPLNFRESLLEQQHGRIGARIEAAVRRYLRDDGSVARRVPADASYRVVQLGLIGTVSELAKLSGKREGLTLVYRPSARLAGTLDVRRACYRRGGGNTCEPQTAIHDGTQGEIKAPAPAAAAMRFLGRYLSSSDTGTFSERIAAAGRALEESARKAPRESRAAQVFFLDAVDGFAVQQLLRPGSMDIVGFSVAVTTAAPDLFVPQDYPAQAIQFGRNIEERIDTALARRRAGSVVPPNASHRDVYRAIYRIDVVGTREWLNTLRRDRLVYGVFVDEEKVVPQRADAADPTPEQGMKRLPIPGGALIPEVRVFSGMSPQRVHETLRRYARATPEDRAHARLLLREPMDADAIRQLLANSRLRFVDDGSAVVIAPGGRTVALSVEGRLIDLHVLSQSPAVHAVLLGGPVPDPDHFVEGSGGRPNFL